jgi:hypothetical protein
MQCSRIAKEPPKRDNRCRGNNLRGISIYLNKNMPFMHKANGYHHTTTPSMQCIRLAIEMRVLKGSEWLQCSITTDYRAGCGAYGPIV